jgi:tetratricopeptide (TPR) repeat protein
MYVQMTYRVPSQFLFLFLPWVGVALSTLSFVFLMSHFLTRAPEDDPFRVTFKRIEWWGSLMIRIFVYYSLVLYANGILDRSEPVEQNSQILSISAAEIHLGLPVPYSWVTLRSWEDPNQTKRIFLLPAEKENLWGGEMVLVQTRQGLFGIPWVSEIGRDEEHYAREILKLTPTASDAHRILIYQYLKRKRWDEAIGATRELLKIYPKAYDFVYSVGSELTHNRIYDAGIEFLGYSIARQPSYDAYQQLGWALSYQGNKARAAEVLERSIDLKPAHWDAYYHLGYVYSDMGRIAEALAMFEKALERRPNFPEVEVEIARLQRKIEIRKRQGKEER